MGIDLERAILEESTTIAVVGCSRNPGKPSHDIPLYLKDAGYIIIPVNPGADVILGEKAYPDLKSVKAHIDVVDVFRPAEEALRITKDAYEMGIRSIWLQLGIRSEEAREFAEAHGMRFIMDRCMMVEHRALNIGRKGPASKL